MKKTITKSDGSVEVVEGTAEEIAEFERRIKNQPQNESPKSPGPSLITEPVQRQFTPIVKFTYKTSHDDWCQVSVAQRGGWLCINPPRCDCGFEVQFAPPLPWYTITYTTSTDKITFPENMDWINTPRYPVHDAFFKPF